MKMFRIQKFLSFFTCFCKTNLPTYEHFTILTGDFYCKSDENWYNVLKGKSCTCSVLTQMKLVILAHTQCTFVYLWEYGAYYEDYDILLPTYMLYLN